MKKLGYLAVALLLPFFTQAQMWLQEDSYPFPITSIAFDPEGNVFVTNQDGRLYINSEIHDTLPVLYEFGNEHGLITAVEFDGLLYLHLTSPDSFQRVVSYDPIEKLVLDTFIEVDYRYPPTPNHFGGGLIVRDSFMYASFGVGNVDSLAQGQSGHGAVIRVDFYEGSAYIYANGLRNPYRLVYSDWLDELWAFDPGGVWEEANVIFPGGNYGFPYLTGTDSTGMYNNPVFQYTSPTAAIIGGAYYLDDYWFTDHFPQPQSSMAKGWRITIQGDTINQLYPGYTTGMAVNPVDSTLHLVNWNGKQYVWIEEPLSIDTVTPPDKPSSREIKRFLVGIDWYQDVLDVVGCRHDVLPEFVGYYWLTITNTWVFVGIDGSYIKYKNKWILIPD